MSLPRAVKLDPGEIYQARAKKHVVAVANCVACSAAFWLGSQANEFYASPSAEVGSIGVYALHVDQSRANEREGLRPTYISAGKYKAEVNPDTPLTDSARSHIQEGVDRHYQAFIEAVSRGRAAGLSRVRFGMGEGRSVGARQALGERMIDGVKTFDQVLAGMLRQSRGGLTDEDRRRRFRIVSS